MQGPAGNGADPEGPVRMCVVCRRRLPKMELQRYVRKSCGLEPDPARTMPGRGMYVCGQADCQTRFLRIGDGRKKR